VADGIATIVKSFSISSMAARRRQSAASALICDFRQLTLIPGRGWECLPSGRLETPF
jgi:hypothetical protein